MRKMIYLFLLATLWPFVGHLRAQTREEMEEIISPLSQERFVTLINRISALREREYYKNAFLDYCMAFGYCQLNQPEVSAEWFDHLITSYNSLSHAKIEELQHLKAICSNQGVAGVSAIDRARNMMAYMSAMNPDSFDDSQTGFSGKMGIPNLKEKVTGEDFERPGFVVNNPRYYQSQKSEATLYYAGLLNDKRYGSDTTDHFVVFYPEGISGIQKQIAELETYYGHFKSWFNLGEMDALITIFYCPDRNAFNQVTNKIHHLTVPESTYGYASSADLVMTGIASQTWLGAMKHELFHIMIRSFVGDIPAWLDEGIASCYESSSLKNNKLRINMENYRTDLLRRLEDYSYMAGEELLAPTLSQLTNYSWWQFSGIPGTRKIMASINYSVSYVFVKYLLDQGKLQAVVDAYRNRTVRQYAVPDENNDTLTILRVRPGNEILSEILGMSDEEMQSAFENYCRDTHGIRLYRK